jgi:DNA polymerase-3 subunit alpha
MSERTKSSIPFVGLHAHSVAGSVFDAIGYPQEHMDFAYENGMDALALTDHGNMNGLAYQVLHTKKMKEEGKDFKPIYGVEAYFLPSIEEWRKEYEKAKSEKKKLSGDRSATTIEDEEASKKAIKSVLNRRRHLILLAQNQTGLNNLFKMISESFRAENFYRYPRLDYKMLEKYSEGVIASSACLGGVYAGNYWENREEGEEAVLEAMRETTRQMQSIFGDRWYGELQWNDAPEQHDLNRYIIQMQKEFGIKLISAADSHYPRPEAWKDRELYKRLGWLGKGKPSTVGYLSDVIPETVDELGMELYPKNGDQMWESYKRFSERCGAEYDDEVVLSSIKETFVIAYERIEEFTPDNTVRLPDFVVPDGMTADQALIKLSAEGMKRLSLSGKEIYENRLKSELKVINDRGFSKYFLTMKAISDKANDLQLTGPGRGSAAGSLVAYLLNITQIDPIRWGLLFERFLRKDATDYPDIDYDVSDPMVLKELLVESWGDNRVAPISNWNTLKLRSLIKDISKFFGVPWKETNEITSKMMFEATGPAKQAHGIKAGVYVPTFEEVMKYSKSLQAYLAKYPFIKTHVETLHGQTRSASRHAGGVVIGEDLDRWMPLINSGGVRQTPWAEGQNVRHLEPMGFIKFDVLGLASLRMIDGAIRHILKRHHGIESPGHEDVQKFYNEELHPDSVDFNDQKVWKNIFHKGKWAGIFQFTETGAQDFCKRAAPTSLIDLAAITSIYRPGPLAANVHEQYIDAKASPANISYLNDTVCDITEETYGFLIFQEQIALLAHRLGKNLSLDEANLLRKVLTKKGTGKEAEVKRNLYTKFIEGCVEKKIRRSEAEGLWQKFEYFSGYGFNKSHAVSYCVLSFQCAWLLNYYPAEWMAAFLDKEPEGRKEKAINIAKKFGFNIEPLNINTSGTVWEISADSKTLIQPLTSIKGLGSVAIEQIIECRPFHTIDEFIFNENIVYSKLNKKALDALIRSQTLNSLMDDRFSGLKHFWAAVAVERPKNAKKFKEGIEYFKGEGDFTDEEKIQHLVDLTGVFPIELVMSDKIRAGLEKRFISPLGLYDPADPLYNSDVPVWFIPRKIERRQTKNGSEYLVVETIDSTSTVTRIRCWGVKRWDVLRANRVYMAKLNHDPQWGFSTRSIKYNFVMLG